MSIDSSADLIITLIYSPGQSGTEGEGIRGITKLQKLVFLLMVEGRFKEIVPEEVKFEAYDFGPYSSKVMNMLETLKSVGIIETSEEKLETYQEVMDGIAAGFDEQEIRPHPQTVEIYTLSEKGMIIGKELFHSLSDEIRTVINSIKAKYNAMKLLELLKYVYSKYPETREKSIITEKVLGYGRRPELAAYRRDE